VWGIDIEEQKKRHKNDELSKKLNIKAGAYQTGEASKKAGRPVAR
jgi:hypothetical protein